MKTQAILIAAIALLLGTDAGLVKPAPELVADLTKPAPGGELTKPAPGPGNDLTKPAPGPGNDLTKPAPEGELTKPAPGPGNDLTKPAPGPGNDLTKPAPEGELTKPAPGPGNDLTKPAPGPGNDLTKPAPEGELTKPAPGPGTDLTKPGPGGELTKPAPGPGTDLTKPAPGGDLTKPATRKVLPHLVLSPELANALQTAENSISSAIKEEAKLIQKVPEQSELQLDDMYIALDDDITVKLSKVKLLNVPAIDGISANPNLEFLNMALNIDFGTVNVGGNFEIVSKRTLAEIPVTSSGEFVLKNSGIKGNGKVGLSLQTNFFKTINYDVAYQPTGSYLTVSYLEDNKRIVSVLEIQKHQEAKIIAHINRELKGVFNRMMNERLDDILAGLPMDRMVGRTAESYRQHARALRVVANDYVDEVLSVAHSYIVDNGLSIISIPNVEASFSQEILFITWWGRFATSDGLAGNLDSIVRTGDVSVDYDISTGGLKVFGSIGLKQLYLGYKHYEAYFQGIGPSGSVAAQIGSNSVFLKVDIILSSTPTINLEDLHIEYARDFNFQINGLGILDWLVSSITTWVVNLFDDQIVASLDGFLGEYVAGVLPLVDPTKFFG